MKYTVRRKNELCSSQWAGGSTTELFIFPSDSGYAKRNFEVRLSSATVESSPSVFTLLPAYHRILMPLSSTLRLIFDNRTEEIVSPFQSVAFEGSWNTVSHGVCTDIGVMFSDGWDAKLFSAPSGITFCADGFTCIYALHSHVNICADNANIILAAGDFIVFEATSADKLCINLPKANAAIVALVAKK